MATRTELKLGIEDIRRRFYADPHGFPAEQALCSMMDGVLAEIWTGFESPVRFSVMAVGGYGRGSLHPASDLDLLLFFEDEVDPDVVNALFKPLWDLDFRVGHQVRQASDFRHFEPEQMESYTAFLDTRFLFGCRDLAEDFTGRIFPGLRRSRGRFLRALVEMRRERYRRSGRTVFQLEPDLKEAPGGLRDCQWVGWVSRVLGHGAESALDESAAFLHRIRNFLHFMSGRDQNVLSYEYQERVADELGYEDSEKGEAAENLMRDYFLRAETIARQAAFWEGEIVGHPLSLDVPEALPDPGAIMRVFSEAHRRKLTLNRSALGRLEESLSGFDADHFAAPVYGQTVMEMMRDRRGIYQSLTLMHQVGLLGRIFPEFEEVRCRVIRDFFHKYTVDEHSLMAIRHIEDLDSDEEARGARRGLAAILREMQQSELLLLALLLHDIGKSARHPEGAHVCSGVEGVDIALDRIGLAADQQEKVRTVIQNHLEMSKIILRRDLGDPDVITQFAELVGTPENLRLLCLLTYADMKAVSPEVLTSWKEDLLWQLYVGTYNHLISGIADDRYVKGADLDKEIAAIERFLPPGSDVQALREFLDGFPRQYVRMTPSQQIAEHFEQYRKLSPERQLVTHITLRDDLCEMLVVAADRPHLFSRITGVLSAFGMNIIRAQASANRSETVCDIVTFEDIDGRLRKNPSEIERLEQIMVDAINGKVEVDELLHRKSTSVAYRRKFGSVDARVHFDDESSRKCTIVEIVATDDIGLLFHISRVLAAHRCDIDVALITTEGNRAIDVFYLTRAGQRLSEQLQQALRRDLLVVLGSLSKPSEAVTRR